MAAKVFESLGKFGLGLAVAGGVVNSALYNGEWQYVFYFIKDITLYSFCQHFGCFVLLLLTASGENSHEALLSCFMPYMFHRQEDCRVLSQESCQIRCCSCEQPEGSPVMAETFHFLCYS